MNRLLTNRQRDVLVLAANGNSNADIARWRGVSAQSVAELLSSVYRRLGVRDRAQAVAVGLATQEIRLGDVRLPVDLDAPEKAHNGA